MPFVLAQVQPDRPAPKPSPGDRKKLSEAASLTLLSILLVLVVTGVALLLLARHRRRMLDSGRRARSAKKSVDAWKESARRVGTPGPEPAGPDDDTVDIDPDDPDDTRRP